MSTILRSICLLLCLGQLNAAAQDLAIGDWKLAMSYANPVDITQTDEFIYTACKNAIFRYDRQDGSVQRIDQVSGLSGIDITSLAYDSDGDWVIIGYRDGNLDLLKEGDIYNLSDLKDKLITADKTIRQIDVYDGIAYVSTGFGILAVDLERKEVSETYRIGDQGANLGVNGVAVLAKRIFAATDEGVREALLSDSVNLQDFGSWRTHDATDALGSNEASSIIQHDGKMLLVYQDSLKEWINNIWQGLYFEKYMKFFDPGLGTEGISYGTLRDSAGVIDDMRILVVESNSNISWITDNKIRRPIRCLRNANTTWVADNWNGLLKIGSGGSNFIVPNGPADYAAFDLHYANDRMYVAAGSVSGIYSPNFNADGFYIYNQGWWNNVNQFSNSELSGVYDLIAIGSDPKSKNVYFASAQNGLLIRDTDGNLTRYDKDNSPLGPVSGDPNRTMLTAVTVDANDHVWMTNYGTSQPLVVWKKDGSWVNLPLATGFDLIKDMIIDVNGNKWLTPRSTNDGIVVFSEGDDLENTNDDNFVHLRKGAGQGNLPNNNVNCMAEDLEGNVWVGTDEGIAVFYCAASALDNGCDAQQIIVERDGFNGYLFESEQVRDIEVDYANRKWVATTNGVWLISADGQEEIHQFNIDNSPLPTNIINDIELVQSTGEVFIATDEGIAIYRSDATIGAETHENVLVYPNPVRPEYSGPIAIKGLVQDAEVKITDLSGLLVHEGTALGGQAIWDGRLPNGDRANAGVYLVFSSNADGSEKFVTKFLIMN